jgi:putative transposase
VTLALVDEAIASGSRLESACKELGLDVRTVQRWRRHPDGDDQRRGPHSRPGNALTDKEQKDLLGLLNAPEFADLCPNQVVPKLADMGMYKASERTMYRVLHRHGQMAHRDRSRPRTSRKPPERVATGPCQSWSWDITYLRAPVQGMFWKLYMVMDVWSRKIVAAHVYVEESDELAAALIEAACLREGVSPGELWLHSDNGGAMKGKTLLVKMQDLGVTNSFSRPRVSDDNPFSEALFRTMKYRPGYPDRPFASIEAAQAWVDAFVRWYNEDHQHSGIRFVTPAQRHDGREALIRANRRRVYETARRRRPERWSCGTRNWNPITEVRLNPARDASTGRRNRSLPSIAEHAGESAVRLKAGAAGESASAALNRPSTPRRSPSSTAAAPSS